MSSLSHGCGSERYEACSDEATADTTAELGCSWGQNVTDRLCRLIRPAADRELLFLRCRGHAVTVAHRSGACQTPLTVSLPYRPTASPLFYDR